MKKILSFIFFIAITMTVQAQHTLSGTLLSKTDGAPVEMATIRLFSYHPTAQGIDSTLVQGAQTTYDGIFILSNIRQGEYN